jgi:galactokinase
MKENFKKIFGEQPKFFCRAPGRVNIIGEHIDYCGYSVLPAAIE